MKRKQQSVVKKTPFKQTAISFAIAMALGMVSTAHAELGTVKAYDIDERVNFGSTTTIDVISKVRAADADGENTGDLQIEVLNQPAGVELIDKQIRFTAPTGSLVAADQTVVIDYRLSAEQFSDELIVQARQPDLAGSALFVDTTDAVAPSEANQFFSQPANTDQYAWGYDTNDGQAGFYGLSYGLDVSSLGWCQDAKYDVSASFKAKKLSGATATKAAIAIGNQGDTVAKLSEATLLSPAVEVDSSLTIQETEKVTSQGGGSTIIPVVIYVSRQDDLNNITPSKYEWMPIELTLEAGIDTTGCAAQTDDGTLTITISNDFDGDGKSDSSTDPALNDLDDDQDGIPDADEAPADNPNLDTDADGLPNRIDLDSDGDGIPDQQEGDVDTDGDGRPDFLDTDSDNDGVPDTLEAFHTREVTDPVGSNQDQDHGRTIFDTDRDGAPDYKDLDSDNDGIADVVEVLLTDNAEPYGESDGGELAGDPDDRDVDGLANIWDLDSDNDTIPDIVEGDCKPTNNDFVCAADVAAAIYAQGDTEGLTATTGWADAFRKPSNLVPNTDLVGYKNFLDIDADGDGINDIVEAGYPSEDLDNDGQIDTEQNPIEGWSRPSTNPALENGNYVQPGQLPDEDKNGVPDLYQKAPVELDDPVTDGTGTDSGTGGGDGTDPDTGTGTDGNGTDTGTDGTSNDPTDSGTGSDLANDATGGTAKIITGVDGAGGGGLGVMWLALLAALVPLRRK
ncbi:MAG: hypothetical protein HWE20_01615 [Gammaproteobacteria bacterium]|nr:hypothetical protein [Gammaproteobacteria bacterium]